VKDGGVGRQTADSLPLNYYNICMKTQQTVGMVDNKFKWNLFSVEQRKKLIFIILNFGDTS